MFGGKGFSYIYMYHTFSFLTTEYKYQFHLGKGMTISTFRRSKLMNDEQRKKECVIGK